MSLTPVQIQRDKIHSKLSSVPGIKKVYFQPPSTKKLEYPCIVYQFEGYDDRYGDNGEYLSWPRYSVTVIDYDVESMIPRYMKAIRGAFTVSLNRFFVSDNLNHWVFTMTQTHSVVIKEEDNGYDPVG